jgi:tetratricopeptide (TPR) repeat protein
MRYLLPLLLAYTFFSCDEPVPVTGDEPRDPLIDSAEKYIQLFHSAKEHNIPFASVYADLTRSFSDRVEYENGIAGGTAAQAYILFKLELYDTALDSFKAALSFYERFRDTAHAAVCNYHIAEIYCAQKNYSEATAAINRVIEAHQQNGQYDRISEDFRLLGKIHSQNGDFTLALVDHEKSISAARVSGDSLEVIKAIAALGSTYTASGDADQGLNRHVWVLKKLDSLFTDSMPADARHFKASLQIEMAGEYFLTGDYGLAIKTGESALESAANSREQKCAAYKTLAELQGLAGREDIQMQHMEKYIALSDSVAGEMMKQWKDAAAYQNSITQTELERERSQVQQLTQNAVEQEKAARQNLIILLIVSLAILLGLSGLLIAMRQKFRQP